MTASETTSINNDDLQGSGDGSRLSLALVILWAKCESTRVGEIAWVPPLGDDSGRLLGRGGAQADDPLPRVAWFRQRPGKNLPCSALTLPGLSRQHLLIHRAPGGVRVECVGRAPMLLRGVRAQQGLVRVGECIYLDRQFLLMVVERPYTLDPMDFEDFTFGAPDKFGIVGESARVWELRREVQFAAKRNTHVLVLGPSGSGKELAAGAIHAQSSRAERALISRNAATLPSGLIDAELFGNVRNYPNPGMHERPGLIGEADGSTLFLDEFGELPADLQAHLLRVLDSGEFQRLGDASPRRADLRLVAATNRDAAELKSDLLARLGLRVVMPSLNERREDIALLIRHLLLSKLAEDSDLKARFMTRDGLVVSPDLVLGLTEHVYALNVRELMNLLWRCLAFSRGPLIELPDDVAAELQPVEHADVSPDELEADAVRAALAHNNGVLEQAWRELGLSSRHALRRLMKKHGIS